jgi:type III secretion protein U
VSEKTEPPTQKKLREAREKGQVAKSRDLVQALLFVAILAVLMGRGEQEAKALGSLVILPGTLYDMPFLVALRELGTAAMNVSLSVLLPLLLAVLLVGIGGNVVQTGFMLALKALKPKLDKLNPATQLKNMFSAKNLIEFVKSVVKITTLAVVLYLVIKGGLRDLLYSADCGMGCVIGVGDRMLFQVVVFTGMVFIAVAGADYYLQRAQHMKELRMTKDEVKREYKEMEGDPLIKSKRNQFHRELLNQNTAQRVRKASVLVTNPTEIAVALYYDAEETPLPVVIAKGEGSVALHMIAVAKEAGVPIMQNIPVARGLHAEAHVNQYIPSALIEPVAEVLRWLQTLER